MKVKISKSTTINYTTNRQSGFMLLMSLLVIVLGASAWFGFVGAAKMDEMKTDDQSEHIKKLHEIKERMLAYAVLTPEIYENTSNTSNPGPGYFPCPDITGDGESDPGNQCTRINHLYVLGWVPQRIIDRNFYFLSTNQPVESKRYWYAVDTRFMISGQRYRYGSSPGRYAPLNINMPSLVNFKRGPICDENLDPLLLASDCVPPLTLDGKGDIVMIIFYAGEPINPFRRFDWQAMNLVSQYLEQPSLGVVPSFYVGHLGTTGEAVSKGSGDEFFNDVMVTITREEWNAAMLNRVAKDVLDKNGLPTPDGVPDLCYISDSNVEVNDKNSWFEECRVLGSTFYPCTDINTLITASTPNPVANIEGQGWRQALGCPL